MKMYEKATENIVKNCLKVKKKDRVVIVTDKETFEIGQAIYKKALNNASSKLYIIEDYTQRPAKKLPQKLTDNIRSFNPTVAVYAASGKENELPNFRAPFIDFITKKLDCRYAHMIGVDEQIMNSGMSQDYTKIYRATHKLHMLVKKAKQITVKDEYGTGLEVRLSNKLRWKIDDGVPKGDGDWCNLPAGEVFTCPENANGEVIAWEVGDYFSEKYGLLQDPIKLLIKESRVIKVEAKNKKLSKELWTYLKQYENGNRMGEFAVGCLLGLDKLIGNLLQDEKFPGIHMAFGHPYPDFTGQKSWDAPTHVDVIPLKVNAWVDEKQILKNGKFVIDLS